MDPDPDPPAPRGWALLAPGQVRQRAGFTKRTIGNAERGTHPPSLSLRRALDQALAQTSDAQRNRFLAAIAADNGTVPTRDRPGSRESHVSATRNSPAVASHPIDTLNGLRGAILGAPLRVPVAPSTPVRHSAADVLATTVQVHRLYHLADYDAAAQLLPDVLTCLRSGVGTNGEPEQILAVGAEKIAGITATSRLNCRQEEALSVRGSLLLLLAIIAARRGDHNAAQKALRDAGQLAEQLGGDGNWLWTAFGPTNVAIHQLSVQSRLDNPKLARQLGETINTDSLPAVLRGRRSQVHLELGWVAAGQGDDALAVLHLLEAERVAAQAVSRNKSATRLLSILLARERRSATPGLRGLASRTGLIS